MIRPARQYSRYAEADSYKAGAWRLIDRLHPSWEASVMIRMSMRV